VYAAIVIVLSWVDVIKWLAKHPLLTSWNVYLIMFKKIAVSMLKIFFGVFGIIVAYSVGFNILLHDNAVSNWSTTITRTNLL
jgi:hypothetical protein